MSQMQALTPQQAKALIELMTAQGTLQREAVTKPLKAAVPSIFGPSEPIGMQVSQNTLCVSGVWLWCMYRSGALSNAACPVP